MCPCAQLYGSKHAPALLSDASAEASERLRTLDSSAERVSDCHHFGRGSLCTAPLCTAICVQPLCLLAFLIGITRAHNDGLRAIKYERTGMNSTLQMQGPMKGLACSSSAIDMT